MTSVTIPPPSDSERLSWFNGVADLHSEVEEIVAGVSRSRRGLTLALLVSSAITSGSLWLLLADRAPEGTTWAGAIISTVTMIITVYMYSARLDDRRSEALALFNDIGLLLAKIRGARVLASDEFWKEYKRIEARLVSLRNPTLT